MDAKHMCRTLQSIHKESYWVLMWEKGLFFSICFYSVVVLYHLVCQFFLLLSFLSFFTSQMLPPPGLPSQTSSFLLPPLCL